MNLACRRIRRGRRADDSDRDVRARVDPRRAAGNPARAIRSRRPCRNGSCRYPIPARTKSMKRGWARRSRKAVRDGITHIIFGDLFLADIRAYREQKLAGTGITPVFPLWERPTPALAQEMIASGLEAYLATVDLKKLPAEFAGRKFDARCWPTCPTASIPAARTANFTPAWWRGRCFRTARRSDRRARRARRLRLLRSGATSARAACHPARAGRR